MVKEKLLGGNETQSLRWTETSIMGAYLADSACTPYIENPAMCGETGRLLRPVLIASCLPHAANTFL